MESAAKVEGKKAADKKAAKIISAHLVIGVVLSIAASGVFAFLWDAVEDKERDTTAFDRAVLFWMHAHQMPGLTTLARVLAFLGSPPVIVSIAVVAAIIGLFWRQVRGAAWTLPLAVLGAGVLIQGVKVVFQRPRPSFFHPLLHESGWSFPSGHSLIAVVVYGLLGYFALGLFRGHAGRVIVSVVTVSLVLLIGLSRVYVGVHYPTDVLAGWTGGLPWLIICIKLHEVLTRHFRKAGEPVLNDQGPPPARTPLPRS